jgi:hypothetical protein
MDFEAVTIGWLLFPLGRLEPDRVFGVLSFFIIEPFLHSALEDIVRHIDIAWMCQNQVVGVVIVADNCFKLNTLIGLFHCVAIYKSYVQQQLKLKINGSHFYPCFIASISQSCIQAVLPDCVAAVFFAQVPYHGTQSAVDRDVGLGQYFFTVTLLGTT